MSKKTKDQTFFRLPERMILSSPETPGICAEYAESELIRLLAKLSCAVEKGKRNGGMRFELSAPGNDFLRTSAAGVRGNGFVLAAGGNAVTLAARTEKGLLNAVYEFAERLGVTYLLPCDENELVAADAPRAIPDGRVLRNPLYEHCGVGSEYRVVTDADYPGSEWMRFYAKLRFDTVYRHAGGDIQNDPKLGFAYGDGAHEFEFLLSKEFKDAHPETCRQVQPDDFNGKRVNDCNFCPSSEVAWTEIARNFAKLKDNYKDLTHIAFELADLPAGGHCFCASCRNYSPSDLQALIMNRFAELSRANGISAGIQMNAYHDTMHPSKVFRPDPQIDPVFGARERCWAHALDDKSCARNRFYFQCLKEWDKEVFPYVKNALVCVYYLDQVLFRGLYPFLPDVIAGDVKCHRRHGIKTFLTLQVGGRAVQPEYNLLCMADMLWNKERTPAEFIRNLSERIAGKDAAVFENYLKERARIFEKAMRWCGMDLQVNHLDHRWLREEDSEFTRTISRGFEKASAELAAAAEKLEKESATLSGRAKDLARDEVLRARFESEGFRGMYFHQKALSAMPEARRTRNPERIGECRRNFENLRNILQESVKAGDRAGLGDQAYYGKLVNPWLEREINAKIAWCDSVLNEKKGH